MTELIIKKSGANALRGQGLDAARMRRVTIAISRTIETSFIEDGHTKETKLRIPMAEIEKRFDICYKYALRFIGDYKLMDREVEIYLPRALQCELAGLTYEPSKKIWEGRGR
jgi:hypothetical protein